MRAVDIIRAKRDGEALSREAIESFVRGVTDGSWEDYQASALLMAIVLKGMNAVETGWLTDAMARSGDRVTLDHIPGVKVGKHSTGGVGDKVSIVLAPLAASCGVVVPKMSGRGLGHTGGTLDKLESIPGFRVALSLDEYQEDPRRGRLLPDQPDREHRARRQEALRPPRRHRHHRKPAADCRVGDEQEARRRQHRARARREVRPRRVHAAAGGRARAGARDGDDRHGGGRAHRSVHHADGHAARPRRRQLGRDRRVHRRAERQGPGGSDRADRRLASRMVLLGEQGRERRGRRDGRCATRWRPARRARSCGR